MESKKMGQVFSFKTTNSYSREKLNYEVGDVKNIHYGDIHTQYRTLFDAKKESTPFINLDTNIQKISQDNYCMVGDVILADASEDLQDVGKSIEVINIDSQRILAGLHTIHARPFSNIFYIGFCGHLFTSKRVKLQIQKEAQGTKVLSISTGRLSNIDLPIPSLEEQSSIAKFFSHINDKVETEKQILLQYKNQKTHLLQNLFI
ncbi:MAG: restriction endonuclease subunit S [Sphingobacteriales bacterium JAD_PAG50586_3]|nr:MAG: restriction endonuclease subunit S [Sphingobacteriales bacterium JAD_PAG50586_3]